VIRADLGANGPVALTAIYVMREDLIAVDAAGKLFCLSRRDLTPRWISTLRHPLAAPPAEGPLHYVFVEKDTMGGSWVQAFSKRSGAEADRSPIRLAFSASSGISATATTAYVGSYGSPVDNKTMESIDLNKGSIGWGFRTGGRITGTPTVDAQGETLLVVSEDMSVTALKADSASAHRATVLWEAQTLGRNMCAPTLTKDLAFLGSDDNFVRCYDLHSGAVLWMKGTDAPIRKSPWLLGRAVAREVETAGPGSPKVVVESFEGMVFVKTRSACTRSTRPRARGLRRAPSAPGQGRRLGRHPRRREERATAGQGRQDRADGADGRLRSCRRTSAMGWSSPASPTARS
jgi:outer membrane protein assembly factor BamB